MLMLMVLAAIFMTYGVWSLAFTDKASTILPNRFVGKKANQAITTLHGIFGIIIAILLVYSAFSPP